LGKEGELMRREQARREAAVERKKKLQEKPEGEGPLKKRGSGTSGSGEW